MDNVVAKKQTEAEQIQTAFSVALKGNPRCSEGLDRHRAEELLEYGPLNIIIDSIKRTGRWNDKVMQTPGKTAPHFLGVYKSIVGSIEFCVKKENLEKWVEPVLSVDDLRQAFQNRVAVYSLEEWTLTEEEAQNLLAKYKPRKLLKMFSTVGDFVKRKREEDLVFLSQDDIVHLLHKELDRSKL